MAFPVVSLLDSFKRAEEKPLKNGEPAKWLLLETVLEAGSSAANEIGEVFEESYRAEAAFATKRANAYWKVTEFSNPNVVATVHVLVGNERFYYLYGSVAEIGAGKFNGYRVLFKGETTAGKYEVAVQKFKESGAFETLASKKEVTLAVGDLIGLSVEGGKVKAWHKSGAGAWETIAEAADATYNKGFVGIGMGGNIGRLQNFEAGSGSSHKEVEKFTASLTPKVPTFTKSFSITKTLKAILFTALGQMGDVLGVDQLGAFQLAGTVDDRTARLGANVVHTLVASLSSSGFLVKRQRFEAALAFAINLPRTAETTEFPAVTLLDSFGRSEIPLNNGGKWTLAPSGIATAGHIGNVEGTYTSADAAASGFDGAYWNVQRFRAPVGVAGALGSAGAADAGGLFACLNTAEGGSGYMVTFRVSGLVKVKPSYTLARFDKGVETVLKIQKEESAFRTGLSVVNGNIGVWRKESAKGPWILLFSVKDSTYTTGFAGVVAQGAGVGSVSNFEAGTTTTLRLIAELFGRVGDETPTVGTLRSKTIRALTAAFEFAGKLAHNTAKKLAAEVTFSGTLRRNIAYVLAGSLSFLGSIVPKIPIIVHVLEAALEFAGALPRKTTHGLQAALESAGVLQRSIMHRLEGSFDFIGTVKGKAVHGFEAAFSFAGSLPRNISRNVSSTLGMEGILGADISHALAGALASAGSIASRTTSHALTAALNLAGSLQAQAIKNFEAALSFAGSLQRDITHGLNAALESIGSLTRSTIHHLSAAFDFMGSVGRDISRTVSATLGLEGERGADISHAIAGTLDLAGSLISGLIKSFQAALDFATTLPRNITHQLGAMLMPFGFIKFPDKFVERFEATLDFIGALPKRPIIAKTIEATLDFVGSLATATTTRFTATLDFTGSLPHNVVYTLRAALSSLGLLGRKTTRQLPAELSSEGFLERGVTRALAASLEFAGSLARSIVRGLRGALAPSGRLQRAISHGLSGELSFFGTFARTIVERFQAVLDLSGQVSLKAILRLRAKLSFKERISFRRLIHFFAGPDKLISKIPMPSLTLVAFQRQAVVPDELVRQEPPASITELASGTFEEELPLPPYARVHGDEGLEERDQPASVKTDLPDHTLTLIEEPNELLLEERDLAED